MIDPKQLQINNINRILGQLYIRLGVTQIRNSQSEFTDNMDTQGVITKALNGIVPTISYLSANYWFTSWDNWQQIINVLNPIAQNFVWELNKFDCEDRSMLMSSLVSLLFRLNTCSTVYCGVYDATTGALKYMHQANIIVTSDGQAYLWDVDNGGQFTKLTSNNPIISNCRYNLISMRSQ